MNARQQLLIQTENNIHEQRINECKDESSRQIEQTRHNIRIVHITSYEPERTI